MKDTTQVSDEKTSNPAGIKRKIYHRPKLKNLGDVRTYTLGGSPGYGESTSFGISQPLGAPPSR